MIGAQAKGPPIVIFATAHRVIAVLSQALTPGSGAAPKVSPVSRGKAGQGGGLSTNRLIQSGTCPQRSKRPAISEFRWAGARNSTAFCRLCPTIAGKSGRRQSVFRQGMVNERRSPEEQGGPAPSGFAIHPRDISGKMKAGLSSSHKYSGGICRKAKGAEPLPLRCNPSGSARIWPFSRSACGAAGRAPPSPPRSSPCDGASCCRSASSRNSRHIP